MSRNVVVSIAVVSLLAACGGGGGDSGGGTSVAPPPTVPPTTATPGPEPTLEPAPVATPPPLPTPGIPAMPPPPPAQQLPSGVDVSNPGVAIKPLVATSSSANGGNTADKAIDGNTTTTRWESSQSDDNWIQFDFGAKKELGYMKLVWENSYGKEYALHVSDDGQTWYQLRYVTNGKGKAEEFFNLNANVRYVRLKGIKRGTQYGYSLYEVEFKSPGNDNSILAMNTSEVPFPADGTGLAAPAPVSQPLETVQFSLPDGTLVTRFGMMGRSRHARERGEAWEEIGYGANETVDAAGNPVDRGPGAHLNFVANYFAFRTWGVEMIDNSKVAGVTKPRLIINQYFQQPQYGGGHSFVRGFDNPSTTGFGWMSPGDLLDDNTYTLGGQGIAACPVVPKPPQGALLNPTSGYNGIIGANDGCSVVFDTFPGHSAVSLNANGVLDRSADVPGATTFYDYAVNVASGTPVTGSVVSGKNVPARALKLGDVIEFSSSFFSTTEIMKALGTSDGHRYYTNELSYVMGTGLRPWYGTQPRLNNTPLPAATLSGGIGSVSYDYADNATFMFQQPQNHIGMQNMQRFVEGRRWIHTNMWTGDHNETGNDRNADGVGLQGPRFNQTTCFGCHINNGRSLAPIVINQQLDTMAVRTAAVDASGQQVPHPNYGLAAQMNARSLTTGAPQNWGTGVRVAGFDVKSVTLGDGTVVQLSKPKVAFEGTTPGVYSLRSAQPMIGMGLLEAVSDADILSRVRSAPDADGVMGKANYAYDPETGAVRLGRYGWKASKVSLRHQTAGALLLDMSVTSPVYPNRDCLAGPAKCSASIKVEKGISDDTLVAMTRYLELLGVPAQRSLVSGYSKGIAPPSYLDVNPTQVAAGAKVFTDIKCSTCHVTEMKTSANSELDEVRNQTIKPYTDLLLHDMGPDLADNLLEGQATGSMWRTSALWGIGYTEKVAGTSVKVGYLHDSRARTLTEAILWHGGEGAASRQRFEALSTADRNALLKFLESL